MDCDTCLALLLVYGDEKRSTPAVTAHLAACPACRALDAADAELSKTLITARPALDAPTLAARVTSAGHQPRRLGIRLSLAAVGIMQLAVVVTAWSQEVGAAAHEGHELNSLDAALAVGFLMAGYKPWRSVGLLPVTGVAALLLWLTAAGDVAEGHTAWHHEMTHVFTVLGFVLLALAVRPPLTPSALLRRWRAPGHARTPRRHLRALSTARTLRRKGLVMPRLARRAVTLLTVGLITVIGLAGTAYAHVTVNSPGATAGGYAKLTFRVPNERPDVQTTKLEIAFPAEHPFASVSVKPHAGWTYAVAKARLTKPITSDDGSIEEAVSRIVWTSTDGGIKAGEFDEFDVSVGPLPEAATLTFKALQTYSNGEVVRWIQTRSAGAEEPKNPAPVLKITSASASASAAASASVSASASASPAETSAAQAPSVQRAASAGSSDAGSGSSTTATVLSAVALLVALIAAAGAAVALRGRRSAAS